MSFPPFILPMSFDRADAAVQSVDPCNITEYLHSKNPYLRSISRTLCNKLMHPTQRTRFNRLLLRSVHKPVRGERVPHGNQEPSLCSRGSSCGC